MPMSKTGRRRRKHQRCCWRKIRWDTEAKALKAKERTRDSEQLIVYQCLNCNGFHVAHAEERR
jgi:hypothetical protein